MSREILNLLRRCGSEFGIELTPNELGLFGIFADELKKWNRRMNLTSINADLEIAVKHFADSLTLLAVVRGSGALLDLGSGGGFPSIPVKIMLPKMAVVSVDSVEKKILFQRHVSRCLNLRDFTALHARGEELAKGYTGQFGSIVSRAFSDLPYFVKLALPLLQDSGQIIAMKGRSGEEEAVSAGKVLAGLNARVADCRHFRLPLTGDHRTIIVIEKTVLQDE